VELNVDIRQPIAGTISSLEPSHLWVLGLARDDASSPVEPVRPRYSFLADCECPDACMRDHENE
jgi:hypothetical protein